MRAHCCKASLFASGLVLSAQHWVYAVLWWATALVVIRWQRPQCNGGTIFNRHSLCIHGQRASTTSAIVAAIVTRLRRCRLHHAKQALASRRHIGQGVHLQR